MDTRQIEIPDGDLLYGPTFFPPPESRRFLDELVHTAAWEQKVIKIYGRQMPSPRLTAWYGDAGAVYSYSGISLEPLPWVPVLLEIKARIESVSEARFNSVLANQYRGGGDSIGWHSDDESTLGERPVIASVSFGAARRFILRHKKKKDLEPVEFSLGDGALLVMRGETQKFWKHQVPKTRQQVGVRVNLTFRKIVQ